MPTIMVLKLGYPLEPSRGDGGAQAQLQTTGHANGSQGAAKVNSHWPRLEAS